MLQLNTGNLYSNGVGYTNKICSVLYSNVRTMPNEIKTKAGNLLLTANPDFPSTLTYNFDVRFEKAVPKHVENSYVSKLIEEFSALATFGLRAIFSPEREIVRILTDNQVYSYQLQDKLVRGIFDSHVRLGETEILNFEKLVEDFLTLDRKSYENVKMAINRFVIAIRHIPENPTLAYTILVSSIDVLISTDNPIQSNRQNNVKRQQKPSARRIFKKYSCEHIDIEYLANDTDITAHPIRKRDLEMLFHNAYTLRSKYIHSPVLLPEDLKFPNNFVDVMGIDGKYNLTLQGLVRVAEQIIRDSIKNGKKIDLDKLIVKQEVNRITAANTRIFPSDSKELEKQDFRSQFNNTLAQVTEMLLKVSDTKFKDIRPDLYEFEKSIDEAIESDQITMFAIHTLHNWFVAVRNRSENHLDFYQKFKYLLAKPYPESLIICTLIRTHDWSLNTHEFAVNQYWRQRYENNEIIGGPMIEAAISLELAERHRKEGDKNLVRVFIGRAVNDYPNHPKLRQFKNEYDGKKPIDWQEILVMNQGQREKQSN